MRAIDAAEKTGFGLVEFRFNEPFEFARYTDDLDDRDFGNTFQSLPAMEIELPENTGTFEEQKLSIALPIEFPDGTPNQFAIDISSGEAFYQRTTVIATELVQGVEGALDSSRFIHFRGQVKRAIRNYQGRSKKIIVECLARKSLLEFASGRMCTNQCQHRLFDGDGRVGGCNAPFQSSLVAVQDITGRVITTSSTLVQAGEFFRRGYLRFKGVRVGIRDWNQDIDPTKFTLIRRPPASWLGQLVTAIPGCDKYIETCRSRWNREADFVGCGYAMPSYHPVFEDQ